MVSSVLIAVGVVGLFLLIEMAAERSRRRTSGHSPYIYSDGSSSSDSFGGDCSDGSGGGDCGGGDGGGGGGD
jgi:hypothetical protein